jgi:uncharacterized protein YndB with AHSA1/START domain
MDREIRKEVIIDAPVDTIFKALTDEKLLMAWFPDIAVLEPKLGGKVKFTFCKESSEKQDRDHHVEGEVLEYVPNEKISYSWKHKDIKGFPSTIVTWRLEELEKNKTKVQLVHSGFIGSENEMYDEHLKGWSYYLGKLTKYCKLMMKE